MKSSLKNILTKNTPLKVCSLILGYAFWCLLGSIQPITTQIAVPLCFYNTHDNKQLDAPEIVTVTLAGKRSHLRALDRNKLAIHIDAQDIETGTNPVAITSDTLFLPDTIKLVHYKPAPIVVTTQEANNAPMTQNN